MNRIVSLFVEHLGVSQNTLKSLSGKRTKKGYWNPETVYKDYYLHRVEQAVLENNLKDLQLDPVWISYFPVIGSEPEQELHGKKKFVKKQGYDVDNYSGMTKMIQDKLNKDFNVIHKDDPENLVGICFNKHHLDKLIKINGYIIVIEQLIHVDEMPNLKKHKEEFNKVLKNVKVKYG